jgi:hypothetical protein
VYPPHPTTLDGDLVDIAVAALRPCVEAAAAGNPCGAESAAVGDDEHPLGGVPGRDVVQGDDHPSRQRLVAFSLLPARSTRQPAAMAIRVSKADLCRREARPFADVDLAEAFVDVNLEPHAGSHDLGRLPGAEQV